MQNLREVTRTGLVLGLVALACRLASVGKELLVAGAFGASSVTDAYWLAMLIPSIVSAVVLVGLRSAYLAVGPRSAASTHVTPARLAGSLLTSATLISLALLALLGFFRESVWTVLAAGSQQASVRANSALVLPAALLLAPIAVVGALTTILHAKRIFIMAQLTALLPTGCVVGAVLVGPRERGALLLLEALLLGTTLQAMALYALAYWRNAPVRWESNPSSPGCRLIWATALPLILLGGVSQLNIYVDRTMASSLELGKVAILSWSGLVRDLFTGTLMGSFLWVLLPHFAEHAAAGNRQQLVESCRKVLQYAAVLLLPGSALLIVCGPPILTHLAIGQFDRAAAGSLASCLAAYGLGLYADLAGAVLFQALLVLGRLRLLLVLGFVFSFVPNLVLNLLLIGPLQEVGLALSTAGVSYLVLLVYYRTLQTSLGSLESWRTAGVFLVALLSSAVMGAGARGVLVVFQAAFSNKTTGDLVGAIAGGCVGLLIYVGLLWILPGRELTHELLADVQARLRRAYSE